MRRKPLEGGTNVKKNVGEDPGVFQAETLRLRNDRGPGPAPKRRGGGVKSGHLIPLIGFHDEKIERFDAGCERQAELLGQVLLGGALRRAKGERNVKFARQAAPVNNRWIEGSLQGADQVGNGLVTIIPRPPRDRAAAPSGCGLAGLKPGRASLAKSKQKNIRGTGFKVRDEPRAES
jgi:hypothetical protein